MFVESEIEDCIKIYPSTEDVKLAIYNILNQKYRNKYISKMGIGIFISKNFDVIERKCVEDFILYKIQFNIFFCRFLKDEILEGVISDQKDNGIFVSIHFYDKIYIPIEYLPDNSEITYVYDENKNKSLVWIWNYKNSRFYIKSNDVIKYKVVRYDEKHGRLIATIKDSGLGPINWWK